MKRILSVISAATLGCQTLAAAAEPAGVPPATVRDIKCYELRIYYAAPGKLEALQARFRNHTTKLFEKHGMTNLGYWTPVDNPENKLVYVLSYPNHAERDKSWQAFMSDAEWKKVAAESEKDGKLVAKVESKFLEATDFTPEIKAAVASPERTFELRTYTTTTGNLARLLQRFREHTVSLFAKHGMTNFAYWTLAKGQPGAEDTLIYLLAHKSKDAADASFKAFREDPAWLSAKTASEKAGGGSLTVENGVKSEFLKPTDFSPSK